MESKDMTQVNIDKILEMFPSVGTEVADEKVKGEDGKPVIRKGIDFEKLKMVLSAGSGDYKIVDDDRERYEFTWVGKQQAAIDAATPIKKTLRPCPEESKNWEDTENLYIEGDNLEVLKLLQESYLGKVKMIYIDPPYNTGKDFIYNDNFSKSKEDYEEEIGMYDDNRNKLFQNTETNGKFHSDWCSMIYSRLQIARNLLSDDGVVFISIDDNEVSNLKNISDEVFGIENFITIFTRKGSGGRQDSKHFAIVHEYVICYSKYSENFESGKQIKENEVFPFFDKNKKLKYKLQLLRKWGENSKRIDRPNLFYPIIDPDGNENYPMLNDIDEGRWRWGKETMSKSIEDGKVEFKKKGDKWIAYEKIFEILDDEQNTKLYTTIIDDIGVSTGAPLLKTIFNGKFFSYPKPVELIKKIILYTKVKDSIILDFFSGSATTAHAVMQLNAEDGGNRKFIMVQLPEACDSKSEAAKAGYKNICEIGKERIRRAGKKIEEELMAKDGTLFDDAKKKLDTGFRVFKVDSSNMKDVYYSADEYSQESLFDMISNIKDDRTDMDLLYACLLDWGVELSLPHKVEKINGFNVHIVDSPLTDEVDLIACFDEMVSEETIREIASRKPLRVVFRDLSFKDSANKINVYEIFKAVSGDTTVKVI